MRSYRAKEREVPSRWGRQALAEAKRSARGLLARVPLSWRLAFVSFGLLAGLMAGLSVLISLTQERTMLANQAVALRNEARLVADGPGAARLGIRLVPPDTQPPPPGPLALNAGVRIALLTGRLASTHDSLALFTPDGTLQGTSDEIAQTPRAAPASADQVRAAAGGPQSADAYILIQDPTGQRQLATLLPIEEDGYTVAVVQVGTPTAPIDNAITTTRLVLALGILGALLLAGALTPPLVRRALRPLKQMEETSAHIADGELSLRLDVPPTRDEIAELAQAFNSMVARLEAAFARQKQFVADVSHELRTPLTALGGGMEMLLIGAERGDAEASHRLMRGMYAEVERMRRLVEALLMLTHLDEGRIHIRLERVETAALVEAVCEQARQLARGQEIVCVVAPGTPSILADGDRLRQVLLNVLDNALKFTPPPGRVEIRARPAVVGTVEIEVEDTGAGIPPEALPHVFERFYRADPARARGLGQVGGSGLGLAIAQGLVEVSGGQIAIGSTLGEGTRVTLRFPALPQSLPAADASAVPAEERV